MSTPSPEPDYQARRLQSIIDSAASVVMAMLLWPFPIARVMLQPAVHVVAVLLVIVVVQFVYFAVASALWARTLGMRLAGLRLAAADGGGGTRTARVRWGLVSAAVAPWFVVAPRSAGVGGAPERWSGMRVQAAEQE